MKNRKYIDNLKLMSKGISLHSIGIDETAWTAEKLYIVLNEIKKCNITILGGDVYKIENGKIHSTTDLWFFTNENIESRVNISMKYVENYENNNIGTFIYSIILC